MSRPTDSELSALLQDLRVIVGDYAQSLALEGFSDEADEAFALAADADEAATQLAGQDA